MPSFLRKLFCCAFNCNATQYPEPNFNDNKIVKVIYNYCDNKLAYKIKCRPFMYALIDRDLIDNFYNLDRDTLEDFRKIYDLNENEFNERDLEDVQVFKSLVHRLYFHPPMIRNIVSVKAWTRLNYKVSFNHLIFETNAEMNQLTKLIMKKYIVEPKPTQQKVVVNVIVGDTQEIKVVCYNNMRKCANKGKNKWIYSLTDPKGSVQEGEDAIDAVLREMKEELGFQFPAERYTQPSSSSSAAVASDKYVKYVLHLTKEECDAHFQSLDYSTLDPEITHIVLQDIVNE